MNEYKVGYGKPPKGKQWKSGQSGNPKGRPKKKKNHLHDAYQIISEPIKTNSSNSLTSELSPIQAGLLKMCKDALNGKRKQLFQTLNLAVDHLERINYARLERKNKPDARITVARALGWEIVDGRFVSEEGDILGDVPKREDKDENDY
jgi:hypothetical protein